VFPLGFLLCRLLGAAITSFIINELLVLVVRVMKLIWFFPPVLKVI